MDADAGMHAVSCKWRLPPRCAPRVQATPKQRLHFCLLINPCNVLHTQLGGWLRTWIATDHLLWPV
eukprot:1161424-Pelagomonas_calceolata.AAC.13